MLEMRDWSLSNILLIAVMLPFGVGPEAAAAAIEEEEDVNPSGPLLVDGLDRSSPHLPLVLDQKLQR